MPTYRCYCCEGPTGRQGKDFESVPGKPVACPDCGELYTSPIKLPRSQIASNNERGTGNVALVAVIHFDAPKNVRRGVGFIACNSRIKPGSPDALHCTGIAAAVTCKSCMNTQAWKDAAAKEEIYVPPDKDFAVIPSPATGGFTIPEAAVAKG
jgi:hypothetical protein